MLQLLHGIKALILDMDGVIWKDDQPIGNLPQIFEKIRERKWSVILATNNSTRAVYQYIEKLDRLDVHLEPWQIVSSAQTAATYLSKKYPSGSSIYVVGETGLVQSISDQGFCIEKTPDRVVAVVVGMDRSITYEKLKNATLLIRAGAEFIGTNPDKTFPTPFGLVPGAGSLIAALEASTGIQPRILGKPNPDIFLSALDKLKYKPEETLVVGDRLETDIQGAQNCGCRTALVLSGASSREQAMLWDPIPDIIAENLSQIVFEMIP